MKFSDFEKKDKQVYEELAQLVKSIIETAINSRQDLPRIQALQARSKGIKSLKRKLEKRGFLDAPDVESRVKDLAGTRVILYSDIDVNKFLQRRVIPECLHVHWEETKAHYPNAENEGVKYEGLHYVVSLPEELIGKEDYARLKGLRCEVQIQTLLAHAFAESSHDIIYKDDETPGFGAKALEKMRVRLNKTVDEYLKPAGHELDKVQADYENLAQGRELFNRGELERLVDSSDNNERYDRLKAIADYLIPHFDDLTAVIGEIHRSLLAAVTAARATQKTDRTIEGRGFAGEEAKDVIRLAVQIISDLRYADVQVALKSLIGIYRQEMDRDVRKQVLDTVEKLASHNLHVWKQVGPNVQLALADELDNITSYEIDEIRPIAVTIWRELLSWEIEGASWSADAVSISRGAIPSSDSIKSMRGRAIEGLTCLLDRSKNDTERRPIISAFWEATQLPTQTNYSNELLATALKDMKAIAEALLSRLPKMGLDLWEHIESHLFREYKRFHTLAETADDKMGCKATAQELVAAIKGVRDRMNRTRSYVRYKTLVGFEGVFSQQWENDAFGYTEIEAFRKAKAARFVDGINDANAEQWLGLIEKCAATKSSDWATFPIFGEFLLMLGEKKTQVALKAIATGNPDVLNFLPPMLSGLAKSNARTDYEKLVAEYIASGQHLSEVAWQYRFAEGVKVEHVVDVLRSAIGHQDQLATIQCLVFAVTKWPTIGDDVIAAIFMPAVDFLTTKKDCRWVRGAWFLPSAKDFFARLTEKQAQSVLENLIYAKKLDHEYERILSCIGDVYPGLVWKFLGDRLLRDEDVDENGFEAIPYQFFDLKKILGRDAEAAVRELRSWYKAGDNMFQFTGGRLLRSVYPDCRKELADAAMKVAVQCTNDDIDFILHVFRNYQGEGTIHPVAKMLARALPEDDKRLGAVEILLENTGVVSGESGMVDAMRERKALMAEWLTDNDVKVQAFAARCIRHLDNRIATEQRDAEMRKEKRKRDYE